MFFRYLHNPLAKSWGLHNIFKTVLEGAADTEKLMSLVGDWKTFIGQKLPSGSLRFTNSLKTRKL